MTKDLARAALVRQTLNTDGWRQIKQIAEATVREIEVAALSEEDETRIVSAQREARAARKFLTSFLRKIESAGSAEPEIEESLLVAM